MVSEEIVAKDNSYIKEEDRIAQRLVFVALENNDKDELREAFQYIYKLYHDTISYLGFFYRDFTSSWFVNFIKNDNPSSSELFLLERKYSENF